MNRRQAIHSLAAVGINACLADAVAAQEVAPAKSTLHVYSDYGWLRGLGMVPSWGARIEDAWWFYDASKMREEVGLGRTIHCNCIRLWIEFTAWQRDPEKVTANFMDAVAAIAESGVKVMPCIFNRWHDSKFDYGGTYIENIRPGWREPLQYVKEEQADPATASSFSPKNQRSSLPGRGNDPPVHVCCRLAAGGDTCKRPARGYGEPEAGAWELSQASGTLATG